MRIALTRNRLMLTVGVAGLAAVGLAFGGVFATAHGLTAPRASSEQVTYSIFEGHSIPSSAVVASKKSAAAPQGAALDATSSADGITNAIFAYTTPGEDCIVDIEAASARTTACSPPTALGARGMAFVEASAQYPDMQNAVVVVPDGVNSVSFVEGDGTMHTVNVMNEIVDYAATNLSEAHFQTASGASETLNLDMPSRTGPESSP